MAEEIQKKVLIDIKLANNDAQAAMSSLETTINEVATATKELQDVTKNAQTSFNGYNEALAKSKLTAQQNREEITRLNLVKRQEKDAIDKAKGSIVAATGSYKEAQQALTKLGNAIKNSKDGFTSTSPAIKAQIKEYNELNTKLKTFDAQMGNHQREVGSYKEALSGLEGMLRKLVPGFGEFSEVLKKASSGFNVMGNGASEAGVGMEAAGAAAGGLSASLLAVAAALAVEGGYLLQFETYSDKASQAMAGLRAASMSFLNSVNTKGGWAAASLAVVTFGGSLVYMANDAKKAYDKAYEAQGKILELNRQVLISGALSEEENAKIRKDMLIMRNVRSGEVEVEKAYQDALRLTNEQYQRNITNQNNLHKAIVDKAISAFKLNKKEVDGLKDVEHGYTNILKLAHELTATDKIQASALEDLIASAHKGIEIQNTLDNRDQLILNRKDQKDAKLEAQHQKELSRQQKEAEEIAKIKAGTEQANSERIASISRMLDFRREAFAKELADSDEHYRQLIFKQREFIAKMQVIADSKKSTGKEKSAARGGIGAANALIGQLGGEQAANQQKLIEDHAKVILAESQKAANDLANLQISAIKDTEERERQSENLSYKERGEASDKEISLLKENQEKLNIDIAKATGERLAILKKELADTQVLIDVANDKKIETQLQHDQKLLEIKKKAAIESKLLQDQLDIISANNKPGIFGGINNPFNKDIERTAISDAKDTGQKQLIDQGLDGDKNADGSGFSKQQVLQKLSITKNTEDQITKIKRDAEKKRRDAVVDMAKQATDATFSIIQQSMQRSFQAQEAMMNRQKDHDLQNTSLTETQKYVVKEKYRIKEGQAKVKQFKQEQELAIVKGIIDTAAAVIKAAPNPYLMALAGIAGAIEIGVIAAQKPPAFAKGGIYNSDGKGGVLPGYSKTDNTNARLRSGEGVVVSEAMRDPWARNVVSAINQSYGGRSFDGTVPVSSWVKPGFASGGVFSNYLPTGDNGLRPRSGLSNNGRLHPDDISGIGRAVSQIKFPPIVTDIKDVNFQNQILSNVQDRRNY